MADNSPGVILMLQIRTDKKNNAILALLADLADPEDAPKVISTLNLELAGLDRDLFDAWVLGLSGWLKNLYVSAGIDVELTEVNPHEVPS